MYKPPAPKLVDSKPKQYKYSPTLGHSSEWKSLHGMKHIKSKAAPNVHKKYRYSPLLHKITEKINTEEKMKKSLSLPNYIPYVDKEMDSDFKKKPSITLDGA